MNRLRLIALGAVLTCALPAHADQSFAAVTEEVNKKLVKVFGAGGFKGLVSYGTGVVVSPDGYVLTVDSLMLTSQDLRVHLADGRRLHAQLVVSEPELDVALLKIKEKVDDLPFYDIAEAAARPLAEPGTRVLGFSNLFQIATRAEPVSVTQGYVAAYSKLPLRRGVFEAPYSGEVYTIDAITNNPGSAGGVITTRKGELLGLIGKELRNTQTDTWINYSVPIQARAQGKRGDQVVTVTIAEVVEKKEKYLPTQKREKKEGLGGYHGIVLVPDVVERTPPYVEEVAPNSPAAKAGLKPDDLIVYVDGEQVGSIKTFREIMGQSPPGTTVKLEVRRGERLTSVELKLEEQAKPAPRK
jgi:serine protease Do